MWLIDNWYKRRLTIISIILLPLSWLYHFLIVARKLCYRMKLIKPVRFEVPVIVVGNITVGGTGKTPFVIWLASYLQQHGHKPGIVSRGYGAQKHAESYFVVPESNVDEAGDEPLLIATKTKCPVVINLDRVQAVADLLKNHDCTIIISDDGLQHYRLQRDIEVAIIDGARQCGNGALLPAGPLREPLQRLNDVDFVVVNGGDERHQYTMDLVPVEFVSLKDDIDRRATNSFAEQTVNAVAAIGNPDRFFASLNNLGIKTIGYRFADHHKFLKNDMVFQNEFPVIMTEKDGVKCRNLNVENSWYLRIETKVNSALRDDIISKVRTVEVLKHGATKSTNSAHQCMHSKH